MHENNLHYAFGINGKPAGIASGFYRKLVDKRKMASTRISGFFRARSILLVIPSFATVLSGCTTASFATPPIPMNGRVTYLPSDDGATQCKLDDETSGSVTDRDDLASGVNLIDNYAGVYKCALQSASNGRQYFQIPSQLATLLGIAAGAFGGPRNLAVGSGIAAATFNSANGYWAPQDKANVFDAGYDAILCIQMAAVGLAPFDTKAAPEKSTAADNTVSLPVSWQYYNTISSALGQVDRIVGSRLRETGRFDPAGLVAETQALTKQIDEAKNNPPKPATSSGSGGQDQQSNGQSPAGQDAGDNGGGPNGPAVQPAKPDNKPTLKAGTYYVNIPEMQARMQLCVLRAKM